jgi:inner membrane protein
MASLGHIVVGMAVARVYSRDAVRTGPTVAAMLFWAALSFLPDADVIGFGLGVRYEDPWGHRGATHSLVFSLALGAAIGVLAPWFGHRALRTGMMATLVVASHALLDTLTDGGLGCALFWPFDLTRYFAPWTPLPVSPIGLGYLSQYGAYVAAVEITLFAPLLLYALSKPHAPLAARWRPIPVALGIAIWVIALWLLVGGGAFRDQIIRSVLRDDTQFAPRYSEAALDRVSLGDSIADVREHLGEPFLAVGDAQDRCWVYSRSPSNGYFRARAVCFADGRVSQIVRRWVRLKP